LSRRRAYLASVLATEVGPPVVRQLRCGDTIPLFRVPPHVNE